MSVMMLTIVIGPPGLMRSLDLRPGARFGERVISEPSLNRDYVEFSFHFAPVEVHIMYQPVEKHLVFSKQVDTEKKSG